MVASDLSPTTLAGPWRVGVHVGGPYTDPVLSDAAGCSIVATVPSVPADPNQGVLATLRRVAEMLSATVPDELGHCALFVHGSTVATKRMPYALVLVSRDMPAP